MGDILQTHELPKSRLQTIDAYNEIISKTRGRLFLGGGYQQSGELFYNKAYFSNGQKITKEYISDKIQESAIIIQQFEKIIDQLNNENILNAIQKKLIRDLIEKSILKLKYHQNAIYIEAEKAGYTLSNTDRILYRKEIVRLEDLLYGPGITEREDRKNKVVNKLHEIYMQNENEITQEEKSIREEKILKPFSPSHTIEKSIKGKEEKDMYIDEKYIFDLVSLLLEIEGFKKEDIIKIKIDPNIQKAIPPEEKKEDDTYSLPAQWKNDEIYTYFNERGIGQNFKIIKKNLGSNSVDISKQGDSFKTNQINISPPDKNGKYNITKKILPIIYDHEISTHVNTGIGNFNNIYMKDPERGDLEEGIALFNQTIAEGKNIEELYEASIGDIRTFLGENFDEYELQQIFAIYFKLIQQKDPKIDDTIRRAKIGVPIGEKGARKQDLTYGNSKEIVKELEELTKTPEGIALLNRYAKAIYSTKLGYESIKNIDEVLDGIKTLDELEPNFPIFAGKIIYWKLFKGKLDKEKMLENDVRRLIHTDTKITDKQKRLLVNILQLIKKYGEETSE